ncbi:MAG: hypothetical protein ACK49R_15705 [Planctomycetota bacterium]
MSEFDTKRLEQRLRGFSEKQRALFALSCAERLYPAYAQQRELHDGELADEEKVSGRLCRKV